MAYSMPPAVPITSPASAVIAPATANTPAEGNASSTSTGTSSVAQ